MNGLSEKHHQIGTEWGSSSSKDEKTEDQEGKVTAFGFIPLLGMSGLEAKTPGS